MRLLASSEDNGEITYQLFVGQCIAVCVIAVLLIGQFLLTVLEEKAHRHRHLFELLRVAYRETALLGFVGFILFVVGAPGQRGRELGDVAASAGSAATQSGCCDRVPACLQKRPLTSRASPSSK